MKYRHKKRGTEYEIVRTATFQDSTTLLFDNKEIVIYKSLDDNKWWAREYNEFFDGRFESA